MSSHNEASRIRRFLLLFAGFIAIGAIVELLLEEHTGDALQWTAFGLAGAIFASVLVITCAGSRAVARKTHQAIMVIVLAGSVLGVYLHLSHNYQFEREIRPTVPARELIMDTLQGGNPLLAPGVLGIAAVLGFIGTPRQD